MTGVKAVSDSVSEVKIDGAAEETIFTPYRLITVICKYIWNLYCVLRDGFKVLYNEINHFSVYFSNEEQLAW
jgi:hypothetical protein